MLDLFLDRDRTISRKAESLDELIRLCLEHGLDGALFFDPGLHEENLPRFVFG